jgi:hypothetical protein
MRLVTQTELMALPEGTLYAPLQQPWVFGDLCIKGENLGPYLGKETNDFYERGLAWIAADDCGEATKRLDRMMENSSLSFPAEPAYSREGLYETDARYLVYELDDVKLLLSELAQAYDLNTSA